MKFFGVHIEDLESENFLSASSDQIAAWLFLHAYCSKQRNGGKIENARSFDRRFWGRLGIDSTVVIQASPLWSWDNEHLLLHPYDIDGQTVYEKKVAGGRAGGKAKAARWGSSEDPNTPSSSLTGSANDTPSSTPSSTPPTDKTTRDKSKKEKTTALFAQNGASSDPKPAKSKIEWNVGEGFTGILESDRDRWHIAYPALDLNREIAAASEWLRSNPNKKKKMPERFLVNWLARAQEGGGNYRNTFSTKNGFRGELRAQDCSI